jgi:hypothetical protein
VLAEGTKRQQGTATQAVLHPIGSPGRHHKHFNIHKGRANLHEVILDQVPVMHLDHSLQESPRDGEAGGAE